MLDLFATRFNRKLEVYCLVVLDPFAVAEDALQDPWDNLEVYAFPPFCLIRHVLNRMMGSKNFKMTLVAPLWPQASYSRICCLSSAERDSPLA